ncbi:glycoside hydrolase superfamily [Obelidium mucronatum]|nr:glycoside hydrolase superfamily [Obelidium mucronatum]
MTVYADQIAKNGLQGLDLVTDDAMIHLAIRLSAIPYNTGRQVRMRWLPEMNGHWMLYGLQPARYIAVWQRMFTIFRRYAPNVILVWSPNYDLPFGDESYWPGAEYVDWVGTSVYWKGFGVNAFVSKDYSANSISSVYLNFAQKYNKPFVISEASGAWEIGPGRSPITGETFTRVTNQVDQATFQQSFWAGIISPDIFAAFPLLRAAYLFEVAKQEEFWSDFRIANDTSVLTSFKELIRIADAGGWMTWANTSTFVAPSAPQPIPESVSLAPSTNEWPTALPTGIKIPKVTAAKSSASSSFALVALLRQEQQQGIVLSLFFALLSILV